MGVAEGVAGECDDVPGGLNATVWPALEIKTSCEDRAVAWHGACMARLGVKERVY